MQTEGEGPSTRLRTKVTLESERRLQAYQYDTSIIRICQPQNVVCRLLHTLYVVVLDRSDVSRPRKYHSTVCHSFAHN